MKKRLLSTLARTVTIAAFALPMSLGAAVLEVPANFPTIQDAIDASSPGDTIVVAVGSYHENLVFSGLQDLSLIGAEVNAGLVGAQQGAAFAPPSAGLPILDGSGLGSSCITLKNSRRIHISGFEIQQCTDFGIHVFGTPGVPVPEDISFSGIYLHNVLNDGLVVEPAQRISITNNWFHNVPGNAVRFQGRLSRIADNDFQNNADSGALLKNGSGMNQVFGNSVGGSTVIGIWDEGFRNRLERNSVNINGAAGIRVESGAVQSRVIGNDTNGSISNAGSGTDLAENQ